MKCTKGHIWSCQPRSEGELSEPAAPIETGELPENSWQNNPKGIIKSYSQSVVGVFYQIFETHQREGVSP